MGYYLLKRLVLAVFTLFCIVFLSYVLLRLAPGDPTRSSIFGNDATAGTTSAEQSAFAENRSMRAKLHLDEPILVGFGYWFKDVVLHGDFGESASVDPGRPVTELILSRLPVTLKLNTLAILVTYSFAILLGIYSAVYAGGMFDKTTTVVLFVLYSLPVIWVGLILQAAFCAGGWLPIFPLKGLSVPNEEELSTFAAFWETAKCYVLPVTALSYSGFAALSRYARGSMLEVLHADFIRTARAKGVSSGEIIFNHAFRNALVTLITLFSGLLPGLVSGSILIEYIFTIPGMGSLSLLALSSRDYPLQMALFTFAGMLTLLGIFFSDLLYVVADPRISLTKGNNQ